MQKYKSAEIKSFEFADLKGAHVVGQPKTEAFSFKSFDGIINDAHKVSEDELRSERTYEKKNNFQIDGQVRDSRGLARQEQSDFEIRVRDEVKKRLDAAYKEAYEEGLLKGKDEGIKAAHNEYQEALNQKVNDFEKVIIAVSQQTDQVMVKNRHEIYEFIKRFTKWIILKEVNEKVYLEGLLEKLILELNARKNLIIKVGRENFAQMPEVIQTVEAKLGLLTNIRVEIVPEVQYPGIILESENGLIDGSMEGVFQNIDKIFEQAIAHE